MSPTRAPRRAAMAGAIVTVIALAGCGSTVASGRSAVVSGEQSMTGSTAPGPGQPLAPAPVAGGSLATGPGGTAVAAAQQPGAQQPGATGPVSNVGGGAGGTTSTGGPIKIGIVLTKVSNAAAFGVSLGNTYQEQDVYDALIRAINKRGGIAGRTIVPVYASTDTASTNWSTDFQAACAKFTQDNHVAAVLGYTFNYDQSFESCLARNAIPHLTTTYNVPDNSELSHYPLVWALEVPTITERSIAKLQGAINTGILTPNNKLGVLLDDCPGTQPAWRNDVLPFLHSHHINVAQVEDEGCADGYNQSFSGSASAAGNITLAFRTKGVDRVTFISVSETGPLLLLSEAANSQHYYPDWIVSSLATLAELQGQAPDAQMKNVHGYGWIPTLDVQPSLYGKLNPTQQRCITLLKSQGVKPVAAADYSFAYSMCESLFVYERALTRTHGSAVGTAVVQAVAAIGTGYTSVLNLDGASMFAPSRRNNVPRFYRHVVWKTGCSCFQYTGADFPMP